MRLRVAIGADHGGFELKQELIRRLGQNVEIVDKGAYAYDAHDDYPDTVILVGRAVAGGEVDRGVLICGSGVGACVAANKIAGVRASVCHDTYSAHQGVEHDDLNVLCLGARVVGVEVATELAVAFLMARFSGEERHLRRLEKVKSLETAQEGQPGPEQTAESHGDSEAEAALEEDDKEEEEEAEEEEEKEDEEDEEDEDEEDDVEEEDAVEDEAEEEDDEEAEGKEDDAR
jgi:ribose 5-phosphate isomerase B